MGGSGCKKGRDTSDKKPTFMNIRPAEDQDNSTGHQSQISSVKEDRGSDEEAAREQLHDSALRKEPAVNFSKISFKQKLDDHSLDKVTAYEEWRKNPYLKVRQTQRNLQYRLSQNKNFEEQEMRLKEGTYFSGKGKLHKQKTYFSSLKGVIKRLPYEHRGSKRDK